MQREEAVPYLSINRVLLTWNIRGSSNMFDLGTIDFQIFEKYLNQFST